MSDPDAMQISLASHPEPVLRYEVRDGVPTVDATNDAFDAAMRVPEGAPVTAVFEQFDTVESVGKSVGEPAEESAGEAPPTAQLRAGESVELVCRSANDDQRYVAHGLVSDVDGGVVVFSERGASESVADGVEVADVAGAITHDLRNPLDVAGAHLEAARETGADAHFDAVADAHDRMERIIQDVLTFTRSETALNPEPGVSVRATAEQAWGTVETEGWTIQFDESLPTVTADASRLQRLFENLFRNSVEHATDAGTVWVGVLTGAAGVYVADDGPGIPEPDRESVRNPGYTVDDGGTGLGLSIVDRIADAHGWMTSITERDGGGARIEIRFDGED